jgi:hypothetical protein
MFSAEKNDQDGISLVTREITGNPAIRGTFYNNTVFTIFMVYDGK